MSELNGFVWTEIRFVYQICDFKNSRIRVDVAYVQENKGQLFKQTLA